MKAPGILLMLIFDEQVWSVWPERLAGDDSLRQAETGRRQQHTRCVASLRWSTRSRYYL